MRLSGVSTSNSAREPVPSSPFPGGIDVPGPMAAPWTTPDFYALGRLLFTIVLIALIVLALLGTIDVLRALCGLLFRLLITIRAARLLVHLVLIVHSLFLAPWNVALSS